MRAAIIFLYCFVAEGLQWGRADTESLGFYIP